MHTACTKKQKGYALLEYCAGAAIIATILWTSLSGLGDSLSGLLKGVGAWADARTSAISTTTAGTTTPK